MRKSLICLSMIVVVMFIINSTIAYACDEHQTTTYLGQVLFGNNAAKWGSDDRMIMLADALYLCSEQTNGVGQDKLDFLRNHNVSGIPALSEIDITTSELLDCSHHSWDYIAPRNEKSQTARKAVLRSTVSTVFGTDIIDNTIGSIFGNAKRTKYEAFAALLYYSHILFDYMANDPEDTAIAVNGNPLSSFGGMPYTIVNGNIPSFTNEEKQSVDPFMRYSPLDALRRAGVAFVNVCSETMPPIGSRQQIGMIKPSGWDQRMEGYPGIVNSQPPYLYNRCHLVAHQLAGNDTEINLITGTRYLNEIGMLPFENTVADYIASHRKNHVLYRATPIYERDNLVASGVQLEAYSVEDRGEGVCFNVYCYNVQPGVFINYANGANNVADITYNTSNMLPFAIYAADDSNPDLIFEIDQLLPILFDDQVNTNTFIAMRDQLSTIAIEARDNGYYYNRTVDKYMEAKKIQYKYYQALKAYIPLLLAKEDFFMSAFK